MVTMSEIQALGSRPTRSANSVLSLYLDVDQSKQVNLNRGFENQLKDMLASARETIRLPEEVQAFESASRRLEKFVASYRPAAPGLAAVSDESDGFFWGGSLDFPVASLLRWGRDVFLRPLAVAVDEYERIGIVLLDRARLRLLTMSGGDIGEHINEDFDRRSVRHTKTVGTDHVGSSSHAQRRADEQILRNLRQIAKDVSTVLEQQGVKRIVLAGSSEIAAQLQSILPKRLSARVIGRVDIAINASFEEIRSATAPIAAKYERESEQVLVDDLVTSAAKSRRVVTGLSRTLHAVNQRRVWQLVYAEGFHAPGLECSGCSAVFSLGTDSCSLCGSALIPIEDVVERAIGHAIRYGAKIEVVRGEESMSSLMNSGGMGAFLRSRTSSARAS